MYVQCVIYAAAPKSGTFSVPGGSGGDAGLRGPIPGRPGKSGTGWQPYLVSCLYFSHCFDWLSQAARWIPRYGRSTRLW